MKVYLKSAIVLGILAAGVYSSVFLNKAARTSAVALARPPARALDPHQWMADHGNADLVSFDRFDRLAYNVWRLPTPMHSNFAGWRPSDVECLTYIKQHVTAYFVRVDENSSWKYWGCSDSRTGHLISDAESGRRFLPAAR